MTKAVTTRVPEETAEKLDKIAEEEHLDRSTLLRKLIEEDIEQILMEKAAEGYREGEKSIEAAAETAKVSTWEMVDYIQKHNITPPTQDKEEIEAEIEEAEKL